MKNLKKVLALVMAFAMAFTMMATAGAAYTDQADIEATEAVEMLNTLGIMTGDPDGSFRPNDTITRAEACRMIYSIRTNSDNADAYANMQTTFTDVPADAWYAGYVKHCQSVGIVSGRSETIFDPSADVTGVELALMCLRVMGYDPVKANIGGSTWSTTTIGLATEAGVLDDVNTSITAACPRQWAAQIMYNMIQAPTVEWSTDSNSYSQYFDDGTERDSVGKEYLKLWIDVGTLTEIDDENLTIYVDSSDAEDSDRDFTGDHDFTKVSQDYSSLLGHKVKVMYRDGKTNAVIGVYPLEDNTSYTVNMKDVDQDGTKVKFDGASYGFDDSKLRIEILDVDGGVTTDEVDSSYFKTSANAVDTQTVTFVDNDGDGKFNIAFITEYKDAEVTYVGSDRITADQTYKMEDHNIADDLEKDDFAAISWNRFDDCKDIVKAEIVVDTLNSSRDKDGYHEYRIGDVWYNISDSIDWDNVSVGDTVKAYIIAGVIVDIDTDDGTGAIPTNIAVVVGMGNNSLNGDQVKLRFFDGTLKTVTIDKIVDASGDDANAQLGYAYKVSGSDDNTRLEQLKAQKYNGYENLLSDYSKTVSVEADSNEKLNKINNKLIDDNAVIILWEGNEDNASSKKITGKQFKALSNDKGAVSDNLGAAGTAVFTKNVNGAERVLMAAVNVKDVDISGASYDAYGYVTSDSYKIANGDVEFTMWDGSENRPVKVENGETSDYVKGTLVAYSSIDSDSYLQDEESFGTIESLWNQGNNMNSSAAVTAANLYVDGNRADDAGVVTNADGDVMNITSDTHVLVVDSDADNADEIGIAYSLSDKLATAAKISDDAYRANMVYRVESGDTKGNDKDLDLLVIDNTGAFDFNKPESENTGNTSDGTVENVTWALAKDKLTVNFDVPQDAVAVSVDYIVKSDGTRILRGTATDAVEIYGDGSASLTLTLPGEYDKDTISVEMSNLKVVESTVSADDIVSAENGVTASVTKTADGNYNIVMSGSVKQGIPGSLNDLFNGGNDAGITAITLKGLIPAGTGDITITQVNKAMNAYYNNDGSFPNDTKEKTYAKGETAEDYSLMLLNDGNATVTVVDGTTTTVYTIVNNVNITE